MSEQLHPGLDQVTQNVFQELKDGAYLAPNPDPRACCGKKFILVSKMEEGPDEVVVVHRASFALLNRLNLLREETVNKWVYNDPQLMGFINKEPTGEARLLLPIEDPPLNPVLSPLGEDIIRARDVALDEALRQLGKTRLTATSEDRTRAYEAIQSLLERLIQEFTEIRRSGERSGFAAAEAGVSRELFDRQTKI